MEGGIVGQVETTQPSVGVVFRHPSSGLRRTFRQSGNVGLGRRDSSLGPSWLYWHVSSLRRGFRLATVLSHVH